MTDVEGRFDFLSVDVSYFLILNLVFSGLPDQKAHCLLLRRIGTLPEDDQEQLVAKYKGADLTKTSEQNDLLLLLLKAHCETRQMTHVHDTAENRYAVLKSQFRKF